MQDLGRQPRMLSDQALGMFQTPEAYAERGLRQAMRAEAASILPDEQMIGYQEGGVRGYQEGTPSYSPTPTLDRWSPRYKPPPNPDRYKYLRPPVRWAPDNPATGDVNGPLEFYKYAGQGFIDSLGLGPGEFERITGIGQPRPDPNGLAALAAQPDVDLAAAGSVSAGGLFDVGKFPTVTAPKLAPLAEFKPVQFDKTQRIDLEGAGKNRVADTAASRDAALKPMQDQADLLGADAKEIERNSKWDALINLGVRMMAGGAPSSDPKSGNLLGIAADGMSDYINTVRSDKDRVRQLKREAAAITAQMSAQRYGMEEQAFGAGVQLGTGQFAQDSAITAEGNTAKANTQSASLQYMGLSNQREIAGAQMQTQAAGVNAQIAAGLMETQIRAMASYKAAQLDKVVGMTPKDWADLEASAVAAAKEQFATLGFTGPDAAEQQSKYIQMYTKSALAGRYMDMARMAGAPITREAAIAMAEERIGFSSLTRSALDRSKNPILEIMPTPFKGDIPIVRLDAMGG